MNFLQVTKAYASQIRLQIITSCILVISIPHRQPTIHDAMATNEADKLITSDDHEHPANLIPSLCAKFWTLGWVTGTGGGCSIRNE